MTFNTNTDKTPCACCGQNDIKGQWWHFSGYNTSVRLVSGYYCPECSRQVYKEKHESKEITKLQNETARLQEGIECHLARPGEGTYECNPNKPCPACRLRVAEERVKELEEDLYDMRFHNRE